jgi:hypothetical protein
MNDLTDLVRMAQQYPDMLAVTIRQYQIQHHLDDQAMVEYLDMADIHQLHLLCLCERPSTEIFSIFLNGVERIAHYTRCKFHVLIRIILGSPVHLVWQKDPTREMWTCVVPFQGGTLKAAVGCLGTTTTFYTGYVDGPTGCQWLSKQYGSPEAAQYECEKLLDALMISQSAEDMR